MQFELGSIKKITTVHIEYNGEQTIYHCIQLKLVKAEVELGTWVQKITNFDELIKLIKTDPIILHFTGKGILNRVTEFKENYRRSILLNGNIDGFYFTDYIQENMVFSSVIRKDVIDGEIVRFANHKVNVLSVSSGPFIAAVLQSMILKDTIEVAGVILSFSNQKLVSFEKENHAFHKSIKVGDEEIAYPIIVCAVAGLLFFNPNENHQFPSNDDVFIPNKEKAKQKNLFQKFSLLLTLFFVLVLTANYFYLGHLNQLVVDNAFYLQAYDEQLNKIANLKEERIRKESLLQSSGLTNSDFVSFYVMEIGNSVPNGIVLEKLTVRPIKKEIKKREKIEFEENKILISGVATDSKQLNAWINAIERKYWAKSVDIIDYEYLNDLGTFEIEITIE